MSSLQHGDPLRTSDFEALARCGISPELAERAQVRRVDSATGAEIVCRNGAGDYSGIAFPYIWPGQDRVRDYRLRLDNPEVEYKQGALKENGKYLSAPGRAPMCYFPPDADASWLDDVTMNVIITEGEKKALALDALAWHGLAESAERPRWLAIAIPGVWAFRGKRGRVRGADGNWQAVKDVIADFDLVRWDSRRVVILFDANVHTNQRVCLARHRLAEELCERGAAVFFVDLPEDAGVNGVDDLIGVRGHDRVLKLIETDIYDYDSTAKQEGRHPFSEIGIQFANKFGYKVAAIGRGSHIESLATKLGADLYIDSKAKNAAEELQKLGGARVIVATAPDARAMTEMIGGLGPNGKLVLIGVSTNPMEFAPVQLIRGGKAMEGWAGVTPADSDDALRFAELRGVRAMIETYPLEKAAKAYARMMSGDAEFRVVLTM